MIRRTLVISAVATALAALACSPAAVAAPSSTIGLYGAQDPTYDGVFRQGAALTGLAVNGIAPDRLAVAWLVNQQCADGSFQEYRADLTQPCDAVDASTGKGPDTNATAAALIALMSLESTPRMQGTLPASASQAADRAATWLARQQQPDGGFPYYPGSASDANSSGLALNALMMRAPSFSVPVYRKAKAFLATLAVPCASGGGLPYQAGGKVDALSTAQALAGLLVTFGSRGQGAVTGAPTCSPDVSRNAQAYLASALLASGMLPSSLGSGTDSNATATAVADLAQAGTGKAAVARGLAALKSDAPAFTSGTSAASALGVLLQVSRVTRSNPRSFGGVNLVATLAASMRRA